MPTNGDYLHTYTCMYVHVLYCKYVYEVKYIYMKMYFERFKQRVVNMPFGV